MRFNLLLQRQANVRSLLEETHPNRKPHQATENEVTETSTENNQTPLPENREIPSPDAKLSTLEVFHEKQKLIEEQNRKRKEMLSKAIKDRKKKTDSESKKLELVHQELEKIDLMLNTD